MAKRATLNDLLGREKFRRIEETFRKRYGFTLESTDVAGVLIEDLYSKDCMPEFCRIVRSNSKGLSRCAAERRRGITMAAQTGQSFITICHAGIVLVCVPVMEKDKAIGGMFFGKCLWEPATGGLKSDVEKRLKDVRVDKKALVAALKKLPIVRGREIHSAAEFLFDLLSEVGGFDPRVIRLRRERAQQSQTGGVTEEQKKLGTEWQYPLESERRLTSKVKIGDRTGAKEILNSILGEVMQHNPGDLGVLRARIQELLSVLSRAAVDGGVSLEVILEKNLGYLNRAMQVANPEDLCAWMGKALEEFIEMVYTSQDARKMTQITPAVNYLDANYDKQVMLADVAKAAHLSISRLAHLFKQQMGITVIDYLTNVRIERAKAMLLGTDQNCTEICFEVGYNNQSYFTRTFKAVVGMTPTKFRSRNRRR
jgi:two-component system response regulator YesN